VSFGAEDRRTTTRQTGKDRTVYVIHWQSEAGSFYYRQDAEQNGGWVVGREQATRYSDLAVAERKADALAEHQTGPVDVVREDAEPPSPDSDVDRLRKQLADVRAKLETIVCTKDPDMGVVLLSDDGPTVRDPETGFQTYKHEHFSPLGDALIEAWKLTEAM
jgi:hypothetical protein